MLFKSVPAKHLEWDWTSYPTIQNWREQSRAFHEIAFFLRPEGSRVTLTSGDQPETVQGSTVSGNLFDLLGARPLIGRVFSDSEARRGERAVVLSYGLWVRRFGAARDVPGRSLEIDHAPAAIIGVMPEDFRFPDPDTQLWLLISADSRWPAFQSFRVADAFAAIGRLKPGVGLAQARSEMDVIAQRLGGAYPATDAGLGIRVMPLADQLRPPHTRRALWILFAAVTCVLIMTCLNIAGLVLARGQARERESAIRAALGAGRRRLIANLLAENLVLSFVGGALGLMLSIVAVRALIAIAPANLLRADDIRVDAGLLLFGFAASALSGLLFGLAPALRLAHRDPQDVLRGGGRSLSSGSGYGRTLGFLVAAEFAAAVVMLAASGLLIRSFLHVQATQLGFDASHVAIADVHLPLPTYENSGKARLFYDQAIRRLAALPGVSGAAIGGLFSDHQPNSIIQVDGVSTATDPEPQGRHAVSPDYFHLLGIPLYRGRLFTADDNTHSPPVAIINRTMARRFWPNDDPLGKRFRQTLPGLDGGAWLTVVGVAGDVLLNGRESRAALTFYRPESQFGGSDATLLIRTTGDPLSLAAAIRKEIRTLDPALPRFEISSVDQRLAALEAPRRFETELLSIFAGLALLLAVVGIYGLLHYWVSQRTREVGIRMALGAQRRHVVRLVVRQSMSWAVAGIAVGTAAALEVTNVLADFLYGVTAADPRTFLAVVFMLLLAAVAASSLPARRASTIDPLIALREE